MTLPVHSELGASQMSRWGACPGSVALSRGMPNQASEYAAEGTVAHEVGAFSLSEGSDPMHQVGNVLTADGYDIEVTEEMAKAVQVYLDVVRKDADVPEFVERLVEHRFHLKDLHDGLYGTADCVQIDRAAGRLRVYDYKHGAGVAVNVTNNKQLKYYGLGALMSSGMPATDVELVIVQPRCFHPDGPVRRQLIPAIELLEFSADLLDAVKRTEALDAPLFAGDHCRWCRAAPICPELRKQAQEKARMEFQPGVQYDPEVLADSLEWIPIMETWKTNVLAFAYAEAQRGTTVLRHKLVDKQARRKWKFDDHTTELELAKLGVTESEAFKPRTLASPADIDKVLKKRKGEIAPLVKKESSGTVLVPETDVREPHKNDAASDFSKV